MAQSDIDITAATDLTSTYAATFNLLRAAVRTCWSGTAAPSSPSTWQLWLDTNTPSATRCNLSIYDGTDWIVLFIIDLTNNRVELPASTQIPAVTLTAALNAGSQQINSLASGTASTDAVNKGQVDGRIHMTSVSVDGLSATVNVPLIAAPSAIIISDVKIICDTTTTASNGTDNWTFQIANVTAGNNLKATAKTTNGAEITANTTYALGLDQNLTLATSDVLRLVVTKNNSPTVLSSAKIQVQVNYKVTT